MTQFDCLYSRSVRLISNYIKIRTWVCQFECNFPRDEWKWRQLFIWLAQCSSGKLSYYIKTKVPVFDLRLYTSLKVATLNVYNFYAQWVWLLLNCTWSDPKAARIEMRVVSHFWGIHTCSRILISVGNVVVYNFTEIREEHLFWPAVECAVETRTLLPVTVRLLSAFT